MQTISDNRLLMMIQAPYFEDYGPMKKAAGTYFPLGIGYISAYVKQHGYQVAFIDPNVQHQSPEQIAEAVEMKSPLLVGISFMTPQFFTARKLIETIKARTPRVPVVLGGAHPTALPERTLREIPEADFVVFGEGEQTTLELLDALARGNSPAAIQGLVWRNGDRIIRNDSRPPLDDLDALPMPDRDLIDQSLYHQQGFLSYSRKAASIHTSRGCPGRCVFCMSGHPAAPRVRLRSIDNVMAEIDALRERYDIDYLLIKDDTFTLKRSRVTEFCEAIRRRHRGLKWHCMGRVNTVREELLRTMKEAGLNDIFFGIESGDDAILRACGKGITTEMVRRAVHAAARVGVNSYGAFILGLPGDTRESIETTIRFACSLPLTMAGFSILIPYPGTECFETHFAGADAGQIDYRRFIASTGVHYVDGYTGLAGLSGSELPGYVAKAQKRFYLRPTQVLRLLRAATPSMLVGYAKGMAALVHKAAYLRRRPALT